MGTHGDLRVDGQELLAQMHYRSRSRGRDLRYAALARGWAHRTGPGKRCRPVFKFSSEVRDVFLLLLLCIMDLLV